MNLEQNLRAFLEDKENIDVKGNSLLVFHKGKEIFRHYTGEVKEDTIFRIFSMTKVVTVTAALQQYELGRFTMDEPVSKYIPEYGNLTVWNEQTGKAEPAKNTLTIRDLFCMGSGLPYGGDWCETGRQLNRIREELSKEYPGESYTTQQYVKAIAAAPLAFEPGTGWMYGLSHDVLGALVEIWSGQILGEYMKEHIFDPLGMKNTFFRCPEELWDKLADNGNPDGDVMYSKTAKYEAGGGGLLSTLDDYMKLADTLTRGGTSADGVRILGRKTIDFMRMDHLTEEQKKDFNWDYLNGYSYGLGVRTLVDPVRAGIAGSVGEFGWCGVLGTWVLMDPEEELTIVYMHQRYPNLEKYVQQHLRAMIYALI